MTKLQTTEILNRVFSPKEVRNIASAIDSMKSESYEQADIIEVLAENNWFTEQEQVDTTKQYISGLFK